MASWIRGWFLCVSLFHNRQQLWASLAALWICNSLLGLFSQSSPLSLRSKVSPALPPLLCSRFPVYSLDQSTILCDPRQWPLPLDPQPTPRKRKTQVWVYQKRGAPPPSLHCSLPTVTALNACFATSFSISQLSSSSSFCSSSSVACLLQKSLPLLGVLPGYLVRWRCLFLFNAQQCLLCLLIRYLLFRNLKHALASTPTPRHHPPNSHPSGPPQRPGWFFVFFQCNFPILLPSTHPRS